jgi:hypothetical protein
MYTTSPTYNFYKLVTVSCCPYLSDSIASWCFQALIRKYAPVAIVIGIVVMLFWVKNKIWWPGDAGTSSITRWRLLKIPVHLNHRFQLNSRFYSLSRICLFKREYILAVYSSQTRVQDCKPKRLLYSSIDPLSGSLRLQLSNGCSSPGVSDGCHVLPPFQNIRCFSFVKQMYLDLF